LPALIATEPAPEIQGQASKNKKRVAQMQHVVVISGWARLWLDNLQM
jgi:hypothetical protein